MNCNLFAITGDIAEYGRNMRPALDCSHSYSQVRNGRFLVSDGDVAWESAQSTTDRLFGGCSSDDNIAARSDCQETSLMVGVAFKIEHNIQLKSARDQRPLLKQMSTSNQDDADKVD